jgi:hypothetical protein
VASRCSRAPEALFCLLALAGCRDPAPRLRPGRDREGAARPAASTPAAPAERELRITVWDSGAERDDAFRLFIDGAPQGQTPLGGERTFTVPVAPGKHVLRLTGVGSPDGQGTYGLKVEGRARLRSGPKTTGSGLNEGVSLTWELEVD